MSGFPSLAKSKLPLLVLLALGIGGCATASEFSEEHGKTQACAEVKSYLQEQCIVEGRFVASPECDPVLAAQLITEACPSIGEGETDWELCALGLAANCPEAVSPAPDVHTEEVLGCSEYIELEGAAACDYYLCRERVRPSDERCGSDGYYLGFGYKYCSRFQEVAATSLSDQGAGWVGRVMPCLMHAIEDAVDSSTHCDEITSIAYASHPQCYADTGFCELSLSDMASIFFTIDLADLDMQQVLITGVSCLQSWAK